LRLQDNLIRGRFLAELTREVFTDLEASKYQHAEMRISIYGRKQVRRQQQRCRQQQQRSSAVDETSLISRSSSGPCELAAR
jgi:hypothetical protein